jgi:hypothetical protein
VDARQAHHEIITEAPDRVVGPPGFDDGQREPSQARHLGSEKSPNEHLVDRHLVVVHATCHDHSLFVARARRDPIFDRPGSRRTGGCPEQCVSS